MSNTNLSVFEFNSNQVRVVDINGVSWFVAKDVCDILGISNVSQACNSLYNDEKGICNVYTLGGNQDMTVVSESGLYHFIFTSRKDEAKIFRKWVTSEVLPSIRKTGKYELKKEKPLINPGLELAKDCRQIYDLLSLDNPRLAQLCIDSSVNYYLEDKQLINEPKLRGVSEIAIDMGYKVNHKNRSTLGKFIKSQCGELLQKEERLVNGALRTVNCYPDSDIVRDAIATFFER